MKLMKRTKLTHLRQKNYIVPKGLYCDFYIAFYQ